MRNLAYWHPQKIKAEKKRRAVVPSPPPPPEPTNLVTLFKLPYLTAAALFLLTAIFVISFFAQKKRDTQNVSNFFTPEQVEQKPQASPKSNDKVEKIFSEEIPNLDGTWAVFVKDLKTGTEYTYKEDEQLQSASIYKLAVMWKTYADIKDGKLKEDTTIGAWSVKSALDAMITVSDNNSAIALAEKLGWSNIEKQMEKEGIDSFDLTSPQAPRVSAKDIAKLLERIYSNTAVDAKSSESMKELLFAQEINDRIPKNLPKDIKVGHKTGEIDNYRHDAGIIMGKNSHYVFVFLSQSPKPEEAKVTIANLAKAIYDAMEETQNN